MRPDFRIGASMPAGQAGNPNFLTLGTRLLPARARGDGTGRKRGAKLNWPSVCLSHNIADKAADVCPVGASIHEDLALPIQSCVMDGEAIVCDEKVE
jgi:hypothetical protein